MDIQNTSRNPQSTKNLPKIPQTTESNETFQNLQFMGLNSKTQPSNKSNTISFNPDEYTQPPTHHYNTRQRSSPNIILHTQQRYSAASLQKLSIISLLDP